MAKKRQTVVAKWDDVWFMGLSPQAKLVWLYLCDQCDHVGIYEYNAVLLRVRIGFTECENLDPIFEELADKIEWFVGYKKLWLRNFINIQYGELATGDKISSIHATVLRELSKYVNDEAIPVGFQSFIKNLSPKIGRVQVGYKYPNKNINKNKNKEEKEETSKPKAVVIQTADYDTVFPIEHCAFVALKDERWTRANNATDRELKEFNLLLEQRGVYTKNPLDYKTHFANWKRTGKSAIPEPIQQGLSPRLMRIN